MLASGFTATPATRTLFFALLALSILISIADIKPFFTYRYTQHAPPPPSSSLSLSWASLLRIVLWQVCCVNSTDLLLGSILFYNLRVLERLWGRRKFVSFAMAVFIPSAILAPALLAMLHTLTFGWVSSIPSGPTAILFALLAQYHNAIPTIYSYKVITGVQGGSVTLSDKWTTYLVAAQLALSGLPGSLLPAGVGWVVGMAWRAGWGPGWWDGFRVPLWRSERTVSAGGRRARESGFEGLRRRMQGDSVHAEATGAGPRGDGTATRRRQEGIVEGVLDQFRGSAS